MSEEAIVLEYTVEETELDNLPRYYLVEDGGAGEELERGSLPDRWPAQFKGRVRTFMGLLCSRFPPNDYAEGRVARLAFSGIDDETPEITEVET